MSYIECPHGDDAATCPPCRRDRGADPAIAAEAPTVEYRFVARFPVDCPACHLPLYIGQAAARLTNGATVHEECTS